MKKKSSEKKHNSTIVCYEYDENKSNLRCIQLINSL